MALVWDETRLLAEHSGDKQRPVAVDTPFPHRTPRRRSFLFDVVPFFGTVSAAVLAFYQQITWLDIGLFVGMWLLTGLGISAGLALRQQGAIQCRRMPSRRAEP